MWFGEQGGGGGGGGVSQSTVSQYGRNRVQAISVVAGPSGTCRMSHHRRTDAEETKVDRYFALSALLNNCKIPVFRCPISPQDGIIALGKTLTSSALSVSSLPEIVRNLI